MNATMRPQNKDKKIWYQSDRQPFQNAHASDYTYNRTSKTP